MDHQQRSLRIGAAVVVIAVVLRLLSGNLLAPVWQALTRPETVAALMYLETGRVVRTYSTMTYPAESPIPNAEQATAPPRESPPAFTSEDLSLIEMQYECSYDPDLSALITAPLNWDLADGAPRVLIIHTHATESYTPSPGEEYQQNASYRTLEEAYNMLSVGDAVAEKLEQAGITVIHDRQLHDYPSYNGSYSNAREAIEAILAEYPTISMILDLHRDAAEVNGGQMDTSARIDGLEAAQLMLVVGTDAGGLYHPNWQQNLALALKLQAQLEKTYPGLCRPIDLCAERFNADESPGALLIEVGAAGNTHSEALLAANALADGIIALAYGANLTVNATN